MSLSKSPTWEAFGMALNAFIAENGHAPSVLFMNGDTGDLLLVEPKVREFEGFRTALNKREFLQRVFAGFSVELMIDGWMKIGEFRFE